MHDWARWRLLASGLIVGVALGCGRADKAQVSGKVLFKDGTVPKGGVCVVQFQPAADTPAQIRKAASGEIREDGSFEAYTRKPGDGVFIGKYDVTLSVWKSPTEPVSLVHPQYAKTSTTPLHVSIEDDVSDLLFEIDPLPARR